MAYRILIADDSAAIRDVLREALVDEGYDVAIRITNRLDPQLIGRRLASTRIVLCASPGYLHAALCHDARGVRLAEGARFFRRDLFGPFSLRVGDGGAENGGHGIDRGTGG